MQPTHHSHRCRRRRHIKGDIFKGRSQRKAASTIEREHYTDARIVPHGFEASQLPLSPFSPFIAKPLLREYFLIDMKRRSSFPSTIGNGILFRLFSNLGQFASWHRFVYSLAPRHVLIASRWATLFLSFFFLFLFFFYYFFYFYFFMLDHPLYTCWQFSLRF